jgi:hypothetical protein
MGVHGQCDVLEGMAQGTALWILRSRRTPYTLISVAEFSSISSRDSSRP